MKSTICVVCLALVATIASAAELTLFEHDNFDGRRFGVKGSVSNLAGAGFSDRASSVVVGSGTWQVGEDAYFRGPCVTLQPGAYPSLDRIRAYATTGAEALMLAAVPHGRTDIAAVHQVTSLPLCVLNPPREARNDAAFLAANGVRILMLGNPTYAIAVRAIYDALKRLKEGTALEDLRELQAPPELLRTVNRTEEFRQWQQEYLPS